MWDVASEIFMTSEQICRTPRANSYEYGLGLILQEDNAGTPSCYLQDGLGSTVGLTDNSGALTATYHYDVYGTTCTAR